MYYPSDAANGPVQYSGQPVKLGLIHPDMIDDDKGCI